MHFFSRLSISEKLKYIILLVCAVTLTGVSVGYMATEFFLYRRTLKEHVQTVTGILGTTVSAAVIFGDPMTADKLMASLASEPDILSAVLYNREDEVLATYFKTPSDQPSPVCAPLVETAIAEGGIHHRFTLKRLDYVAPLFYEGDAIGRLHIRCTLTGLYTKFQRNIAIMLAMLALSLIGAYSLSARLQRRISGPIIRLAAAMERVSAEGNYALRVPRGDADEIGTLTSGFNQMLGQIEERDRRLEAHSRKLESMVADRTAALTAANSVLQEAIESAQEARKRAENASKAKSEALDDLKRTQAQLVQAGKLASIGELAAGVAHELNQPLMVIRGNVQIMNRSLPSGRMTREQIADGFKNIEKNTSRMMNIIDHLRTFSRQSATPFAETDLNEAIRESFLMIGEQLRLRNIEVDMDLDETLPAIHGSGQQLEQVALNLITNARDAIFARAETESDPTGYEGRMAIRTAAVPGGVEMVFEDNGRGIPDDAQQKIFDPFFTTKEVGRGTGLGLSISFGIIEAHKGRIGIARTSEAGTAFRIFLPAPGPPFKPSNESG